MALRSRVMSIRVPVAIAKAIEELAAKEGVSLSQMGARLIEEALVARAGKQVDFQARLEAQAQRALARAADRLAYLASVAALEASAHRLMHAKVLAREMGPEAVKRLSREARAEAARRLKAPDELLREVLRALEEKGKAS